MKDHTPEIRKGIDYFDFRPFDSNYPDTNFYNLNVCDYDVFLTNEDEVKTHLKQLKESIEEAGIYRKKYSTKLKIITSLIIVYILSTTTISLYHFFPDSMLGLIVYWGWIYLGILLLIISCFDFIDKYARVRSKKYICRNIYVEHMMSELTWQNFIKSNLQRFPEDKRQKLYDNLKNTIEVSWYKNYFEKLGISV